MSIYYKNIGLILILQFLNPSVELVDSVHELGDRIKQPVEEQSSGNQGGVALALHHGFLVAEVVGRRAVVGRASGSSLVLPVDVHQQEQAKWNH